MQKTQKNNRITDLKNLALISYDFFEHSNTSTMSMTIGSQRRAVTFFLKVTN